MPAVAPTVERQRPARHPDRGGVPGRHDEPGLGRRAGRSSSSATTATRRSSSTTSGDPVIVDDDAEDRDRSCGSSIRRQHARAFARRCTRLVSAGPAAVPVLRRPARPRRAHLPARQRLPALTGVRARPRPRPRPRSCWSCSALGELELEGRLVDASNLALLARLERRRRRDPGASTSRCAGSGRCGTSPTARWPAARSPRTSSPPPTGWDVVPPTVLRDGPFGPGRCSCGSRPGRQRCRGRPTLPRPDELVDVVPRGKVEPGWLPVLEAESTPASRWCWSTPTARTWPDGRARRRHQQRRPQGRRTVLDDADGSLWGVRPRRQLPRASDKLRTRAVGLGGRAAARRELSRLDGLAVAARPAGQQPGAGCSSELLAAGGDRRHCARGWPGCCARARFPRPGRRLARPSRGRRS